MSDKRLLIAKRVAKEFKEGMLVNLGIGIPTMIPAFLPDNMNIWIESENGILGLGPPPEKEQLDPFITDAGAKPVTIVKGGSTFDSNFSFGLIRGGHIDITVLGAFQVDEKGNLANWVVPGGKLAGMGGAMDLVTGAKKVIIATEHCDKEGNAKIKRECDLPLTGAGVVDMVVSELGVFVFTDRGMELSEIAPGVSIEEVVAKTEAKLFIPENVSVMNSF